MYALLSVFGFRGSFVILFGELVLFYSRSLITHSLALSNLVETSYGKIIKLFIFAVKYEAVQILTIGITFYK